MAASSLLAIGEFQEEYLTCPTDVPHTFGALDGKHRAMKKLKKTGCEYYNDKGFFSLVLLALVDAGYRISWEDVWSRGSLSDAQIFNRSKVRKKIEDGTSGLPPPETLGRED